MKVNISIVLYKTPYSIFNDCANCIVKSKYPVDVYVIDNSPVNHFEKHVAKFGFKYIHIPSNPGYGAGHNRALIQSINQGAQYHIVLNADVTFQPDAIEKIVQFMNDNPNIAQLMPKILNVDGSLQRLCKLLPNPYDLLIRRFFPRILTRKSQEKFELWNSGYDKITFVPYLSGCFMFLRVSALKSIGIFDERFFMYPEDIDLTRRLASRYDTVFFPDVSVTHLHGSASHKSLKMLLIHAHNMIKYFNKWGWFFDQERNSLNRKALSMIEKNNNYKI